MLGPEDIDDLLAKGATVHSIDGDKIGPMGQVYLDEDTERPSWMTVRTGLFGISESFVPFEGALTEGQDIRVPYTKDQITDAPQLDTDLHLETAETDRCARQVSETVSSFYFGYAARDSWSRIWWAVRA
ncbi:PRC-barrel domain-containing protein, partial [Arthrobacter sp. UYEF20]|uniref:PRC-barrel domain-containing protein n=1 Tax=Arthrobacter sp. UYEF20 TaxID=1756363 RepID=UPI003391F6DD